MTAARPPDPDDAVPSPCIRVCQLDPGRRVCLGCLRTVDEIARWGGMSSTERRSVLAALAARRAPLLKGSR